jgi:hypothetical protein
MVLQDGRVYCGGPTPTPTPAATATPTITPTPTHTPTYTPTITPTPTPVCTPPFTVLPGLEGFDADCDGAPDADESGGDPFTCGTRNPNNPWDLYDVPAPTLASGGDMNNRNSAINITGDVLAVLEYSGTASSGTTCNSGPDGIPNNADDRCYDSDEDGDGMDDGLAYDRSPGSVAVPPHPWSDAPDGAISISTDVLLVLDQTSDSCVAPP